VSAVEMSPVSIVVNAGREPDPRNPHTHLRLLGDAPGTAGARVMYGCLRPSLNGHVNSAAAFALSKITVAAGPDTLPWTPTAERVEVLLPRGACDRFADPRVLMDAVDGERPDKVNALLAYFTFTFSCDRLHEQYELVRAFIRQCVVDAIGVGVLLVQHAPHRAGSANEPHVHALVAGPRRLGPLGFVEPIPALMRDSAHPLVRDAFRAFERRWPKS
jgi:hypothetical protein